MFGGMNQYFELCQAVTWALYTIRDKSKQYRVHLDIKNIDPVWVWFLCELRSLDMIWNVKKESNYLVFWRDSIPDIAPKVDLHIRLFEGVYNSVYAGLYDESGNRWGDVCLVIWDGSRPHLTNSGYAPGRCPDTIAMHST